MSSPARPRSWDAQEKAAAHLSATSAAENLGSTSSPDFCSPRASPALSIRSLPDYYNGRRRGRTNGRSSRENWTRAKDLIIKDLISKQMMSRSLIRAADGSEFQSFIPRLLEKQIQEQMVVAGRSGYPEFEGRAMQVNGAVLFCDASGFTALTEKLAQRPGGAERLRNIINKFFKILIDVVLNCGGDVIKFAGDAVLIVFPVHEGAGECPIDYSPDLKTAVMRAVQCQATAHKKCDHFVGFQSDTNPAETVSLTTHMGIGAGHLTAIHVGGVFGRYEYVMVGDPIEQIKIAEPLAASTETCISPEAYRLIENEVPRGECPVVEGAHEKHLPEGRNKYRRITKLTTPLPETHKVTLAPMAHSAGLLQRYIPASVVQKIKSGHHGLIAELREISVLFIAIHGIDLTAEANGGGEGASALGQALMLQIQKHVFAYEGSINKMMTDDKGLVCVAVLGLPPLPHEDDPRRAVLAAMQLIEGIHTWDSVDAECSIGISSGQAFCGVVGSDERREYTVMGDMVNLSARLMAKAEPGSVLVDEVTFMQTHGNFGYEALDPVVVKGKLLPIKSYRPVEDKEELETKNVMGIMGRSTELWQLRSMVASLNTYTRGGVLLVTGDKGSGRPSLINALTVIAEQARMVVLKRPRKHDQVPKKKKDKRRKSKPAPKPRDGNSVGSPACLASGMANASEMNGDMLVAAVGTAGTLVRKDLAGEIERGVLEDGVYNAWWPILDSLVQHARSKYGRSPSSLILTLLAPEQRKFAHQLNEHIPFLRDHPEHQIEEQGKDSERGNIASRNVIGKMIETMIVNYAKHHNIIVVVHLESGVGQAARKDFSSWQIAHNLAMVAMSRSLDDHCMIVAITSCTLVRLESLPIEITETIRAAEETKTTLQLAPFSRVSRDEYLVEVLRRMHAFQLPAAAVPDCLFAFVGDFASGVPKFIEDTLKVLIDEKLIKVIPQELSQGGLNGVSILSEALNGYYDFLDVSRIEKICKIPKKMLSAAREKYDRLEHHKQLVLSRCSLLKHFSITMVRGLITQAHDSNLVDTLEGTKLEGTLAELCEQNILVRTPSVDRSILIYDKQAKTGYEFQCKLFQLEIQRKIEEGIKEELHIQLDLMKLPNFVNSHALESLRDTSRAEVLSPGLGSTIAQSTSDPMPALSPERSSVMYRATAPSGQISITQQLIDGGKALLSPTIKGLDTAFVQTFTPRSNMRRMSQTAANNILLLSRTSSVRGKGFAADLDTVSNASSSSAILPDSRLNHSLSSTTNSSGPAGPQDSVLQFEAQLDQLEQELKAGGVIVKSAESSDVLVEFEQLGSNAAASYTAPRSLPWTASGGSLATLPADLCAKADCSDLRIQNAKLTAEVTKLTKQLRKGEDKQRSGLCNVM